MLGACKAINFWPEDPRRSPNQFSFGDRKNPFKINNVPALTKIPAEKLARRNYRVHNHVISYCTTRIFLTKCVDLSIYLRGSGISKNKCGNIKHLQNARNMPEKTH